MIMKWQLLFSDFVFLLLSESEFEVKFFRQPWKNRNYGNKPGTTQIGTTEKKPG